MERMWLPGLCGFAQRLELPELGEPLQGTRLDLPHPLARYAEPPPDLLERHRPCVTVHAVAEPDHLALLLGKLPDSVPERLLGKAHVHLLGGLGRLTRDEVAERGVFPFPDRLVEARDHPGRLPRLAYLLLWQLRRFRDLLVSG